MANEISQKEKISGEGKNRRGRVDSAICQRA